ncbi:MAG: basic amino acid ABC transporter substrate-binding protein [Thermosynechococcaceae cyanobacterium]
MAKSNVQNSKVRRSQFLKQCLAGLGVALLMAACGGDGTTTGGSSGAKILKVATEPAFAPFESKAADGQLEGFDIEIMQAAGKAAGLTVEFQSLPFDGIIPALQANTVDAAISAMTITPERTKTVDFSRPYFKAGLAIAVQDKDTSITSLDSLKNKKIAVQIGTTGATTAKGVSGAKVSSFDSAPLALQELANGNVDAVVNDAPVTLDAIKKGNIKGLKVVGQLLTEEYYGIAFPKGSANLSAINTGLDQLITDGTYAEIYKKWFGAEPPKLPDTVPAAKP